MDPEFWTSTVPQAPGAEIDPAALRVPGLEGLVLFQTSGSTGEPKWLGLSREALLLSAAVVNGHLGVDERSRWGLSLPLNHVGGFGVVARAFEAGCGLGCYGDRWNAQRWTEWVGREKISHSSLVPTQVHDLVEAGLPAPPSLRALVVGGGVLSAELGVAARALGWPVLASYGMTEAGSQIATQDLEFLKLEYSVEPMPVLPHWQLRIGEGGRIELCGAALFSGWLRRGAGGWEFERRRGEWLVSSDLGTLGSDGLRVRGRVDSLVKILGELVDPVEVEREIGLAGVAVVALEEARGGHALWAIYDREEQRVELERRLEGYNLGVLGFRRIAGVLKLEALPRNELGKFRRAELLRLAEQIRI